MHRLLGLRMIAFEAPDVGAGGGGGDAPVGGGGAFDWGEVSDDFKGLTEGKTPMEALQAVVEERDAHKAGATRRHEQIVSDLEGDDEFAKAFAEKRGLVSSPKDDAAFIELGKSRITDDTKYSHPEIEGSDASMLDAFAASARAQGIVPSQYKAMMSGASEAIQAAAQQSAEAMDASLKEKWGDDYDENNVQIDNFLRAVGDESSDGIVKVLARFPPDQQEMAADVLAMLGKKVGASEHGGDKGAGSRGGSAGGADASEAWIAAKAVMSEAGGFDKMSGAQKETYKAAYEAYKKSKES